MKTLPQSNKRSPDKSQQVNDLWSPHATDESVYRGLIESLRDYAILGLDLTGNITLASGSLLNLEGGGHVLANGQSLDEVGKCPARIQAVTLEDVRRVAARYLAPSALRLCVVGSPKLRPG